MWQDGFAWLQQDGQGHTLTRTEHAGLKPLYLWGTQGEEILLRDGLDSVTGSVAPGQGSLQSNARYDAWGVREPSGQASSRHGYTGHLHDGETGLIYARARYYDPQLGRFISQDPQEGAAERPVSWNAYLYGAGNPLRYVDPSGEVAELEELAANLQGASQHVRAQAGHTQGVLGSLELIGARMALDVAAAGVSLANMVGDGYVMIGGELGLASGQRFAESAASSQGRINDAKHLYHYMAHEDGVAETAAAARQWGGRLLAGDREAANDLGSVSLGAVLGGFSSGRRLASSAADAAPKPGRVVWLVDEDVVKVRESSELPASAMRERGVATVQAETPTSDAIRARVLANSRASGEVANSELTIAANAANGNPAAITRGIGSLNGRQAAVLEQLPEYGSNTVVHKSFGQNDLAALTAATGEEFAMFTTGGRRLIYRGDASSVPITPELASDLAGQGWRWSSHVHPGVDASVLRSSIGDRAVLGSMGGNQSAILNSMGQRRLFTPAGDSLNGWTPW